MSLRIMLAVFASFSAPLCAVSPVVKIDRFLYGASVYPELQSREEWNRMLDDFEKAHFNVVRVSESSWGNLETAPGKYNFGWLRSFLDDVNRRRMKAILGTSSYIVPQWLAEQNPEILMQLEPGVPLHPQGRHSVCLNHPVYREAVRRYVLAIGKVFKDHPAVIGWQLDNEIEHKVNRVCYNPACERAWHEWLKKTYRTTDEFNRRLLLVSWGMQSSSLDKVPLPGRTIDGSLPALRLANLHFRRDTILKFFAEQTQALREAGVKHWVTTDWNTYFTALADDPLARKALDVASLNFYQPSAESPDYWETLGWHLDMHRSAHGLGQFLVTETRVGVAGDTVMWDPFPTREQWKMWMLQPAAYGAFGLMFWSGNRWHGGHWPHWGGVLDWTGRTEPDFAWLVEIGAFFDKFSDRLLRNPVKATAAVITDFDQRAALDIYKHTPSSPRVVPEAFDALRRLGFGVDSIAVDLAAMPGKLSPYALVVIPAATALDDPALPAALKTYVENGGNVVVTPFTAYMSWDGVFRRDGFGGNLAELTGASARTARRMGTSTDKGREDQRVAWLGRVSPVGIDGFCEYLDLKPGAEVLGRFQSSEPVLNDQPAASRRRHGKGSAIKMAFWPTDDSVAELFRSLAPASRNLLAAAAPRGVQAVPRADGSLFVVNTSADGREVRLARQTVDRISGRKLEPVTRLKPYEVLWIE